MREESWAVLGKPGDMPLVFPRPASMALIALFAGWLSACETEPATDDRPAVLAVTPETELLDMSTRVALQMRAEERRFSVDPPLPSRLSEERCDASVGPAPAVIRALDSRADQRQLLPLNVLRALETNELATVRASFVAPSDPLAMPTYRRLLGREAGLDAERKLAALREQRWVVVVHVVNYEGARLVRKKNELRRSWIPGVIDTWLGVYEVGEDVALCGGRVTVRNDVTDAPIRLRLRTMTRDRLVSQLTERWQSQARELVARVAPSLRWPGSKQPSAPPPADNKSASPPD